MSMLNDRSRYTLLPALAATVLTASTSNLPTNDNLDRPPGSREMAQAAPTRTVRPPQVEPFVVTQSGFELLWRHLR